MDESTGFFLKGILVKKKKKNSIMAGREEGNSKAVRRFGNTDSL